jgi:hypothetical protein
MPASLLVIACGAIARELVQVQKLNHWDHIEFQCLPAELHNTPDRIPGEVEAVISAMKEKYAGIFVAYADCGTGGMLDKVLDRYGIQRLPGAHCYEFYAGSGIFAQLADEEPGTFYLTDFLVHSFDRLVKEGLGLNRHPQLMSQYFGNYRRVVYLAQSDSKALQDKAKIHADYLGLDYEYRFCGLEPLSHVMKLNIPEEARWPN